MENILLIIYLNIGVFPRFWVFGINTTRKPDKKPNTVITFKDDDKLINSVSIPTTKGPNAPPPEAPIPQTIPEDKFDDFFGTTSPIREIVSGKREYVKNPKLINQIRDGMVRNK